MNTATYLSATPPKPQNPVVLLHLATPYNSRTYPNILQHRNFQIAPNPQRKLQIFETFRNLPTAKSDFEFRRKSR